MARMQELRARIAARLASFGLGPVPLIVVGFAAGLAVIPLIALQHSWIATIVLLMSVFVALLGRTNAGACWRDLSQTFDLIVLAGVPFAFALADPARALAACFLFFGIVTTAAVSLFALHLHRLDGAHRSAGVAAFVLACAMPQWFSLIAYALGVVAFVAAGTGVSLALARSGD